MAHNGVVAAILTGVSLVGTACAPGAIPITTEADGLVAWAPRAAVAPGPQDLTADAPAAFELQFRPAGRQVQALAGDTYEIRAMFTEAVVRSQAELADFHVGLKALPNSLLGYTLNAPPAGTPAGSGAPRLRLAQHPNVDDLLFPSLTDGTQMLNPTQSPDVYFLGRGILKTAHAGGSPAAVLDPFSDDVSSTPIGSVNDVPSLKLGFATAENLFNKLWGIGAVYIDGFGVHTVLSQMVDRNLTDNTELIPTRFYKWTIPFDATTFYFGTALPLGRMVIDVRVLDADGTATAAGASQVLLQPGANLLVVSASETGQGMSAVSLDSLPK